MSVQRFNKSNSDIQPTHIYYDMNLLNNDSSFPSQPVRFNYRETRSNYYLLSPQDYYMSIVRFYIQTPTLPVLLPQINLNTNGNFGGNYPIASMTGAINNLPFTVSLYTNIPIKENVVVYMGYSGSTQVSATGTDVNTGNNYYRTSNLTTNLGYTQLTLFNPNPLTNGVALGTSIPADYIGNNTKKGFSWGGTQYLTYANIPISSLVYTPNTNTMVISITPSANPTSLVGLYEVGDTIFINNSKQYNGTYIITLVTAYTITVTASNLQGVSPLLAYAGGGSFSSAGDFYNITAYNITQSYYKVGTGSGASVFTTPVYYTPSDLTTNPPQWTPTNAEALSIADVTGEYYWVYSYQAFIKMINQALTNSFWGVNGSSYNLGNGGGGVQPPLPMSGTTVSTYQPPSISWSDKNIAIITADNSAYAKSNPYDIVSLSFNLPLSTLLDTFPYYYPAVLPSSNLYSTLVFDTNQGAGLYVVSSYSSAGVVAPQYTAIQIYQQNSTNGLMNPIQSIVFSSTLLPVQMENVGLPLILNGTSPNNITIGSSANVFPIVTDFQVPVNETSGYISDISYVPSGEYRLVDLYGENPANSIDIQIYWKDNYGLIHPFLIGSGCQGNIKVMFRKKSYNNITLES